MLKQVMNNNKPIFSILFCVLYLTHFAFCKVAYRRDGDLDKANLVDSPGSSATPGSSKEKAELSAAPDASKEKAKLSAAPGSSKEKAELSAAPGSSKENAELSAAAGSSKDKAELSAAPDASNEKAKLSTAPGSSKEKAELSATPGSSKENAELSAAAGSSKEKAELSSAPGSSKEKPKLSAAPGSSKEKAKLSVAPESSKGCWISLKEETLFQKMNQLEEKYKETREEYARAINSNGFDRKMLEALTKTRGIAERALQKFRGNPKVIPAGLNLGSYCMMKMPGSVLFFYRLKLRNNTHFTINFIHNDVEKLTLTMRFSLNDLHLLGQYERALTSRDDPSRLYYRPNNGEVEFLLKDVKYKVEGQYRLLEDRLHIEHIISELPPMEILMRYTNDKQEKSTPLSPKILKDYLNRMQNDLDHWLKDYLNDFLMLYEVEEIKKNKEIQEYENQRTIIMNQFFDQTTSVLNKRLRKLGPNLMMPDFTLTAVNGMEIRLYDGVVRGLDSMYRRSVTTGKKMDKVRHVESDIGFSGLKAEYRYDTYVKTGLPPVSGMFVLNSDDVSAHMALQVVQEKPSVPDLLITYLRHDRPEALTIEGPANRIIANFNHILEHHIISIMSSMLVHHIRSLSALTKCEPNLPSIDGSHNYLDTEPPDNDDDGPTEPDDDSPTEPPDNDDEGPTEPDDDSPTEPPDNDDDGPTEPDDDSPTEPPDNDDDGPTEPDDDSPTESPDDDDDGPTEPDDDSPTEPPDNDDDGPTEPDDDSPTRPANNNDANGLKPQYAFERKESVELELPPKDGSAKGESYKIDHNETFFMTKLNNDDDVDSGSAAVADNKVDAQSGADMKSDALDATENGGDTGVEDTKSDAQGVTGNGADEQGMGDIKSDTQSMDGAKTEALDGTKSDAQDVGDTESNAQGVADNSSNAQGAADNANDAQGVADNGGSDPAGGPKMDAPGKIVKLKVKGDER